jgi:hypothetical protein
MLPITKAAIIMAAQYIPEHEGAFLSISLASKGLTAGCLL